MKGILKTVILATALTAATGAMAADYGLTPVAVTADKGKTVDLQVVMTNNDLKVTSFQFDLYLPEGVEVEVDEYGSPMARLSADRKRDHVLTGAIQSDGAMRFLSYSNNNLAYTGSNGVILTTPLKVNAAPGKYDITIKMGSLTEAGTFLETFTPEAKCVLTVTDPEATVTKPGDFDGNGSISVGDLQVMLNAILTFTPDSRFDLTGDGAVNAADIAKMVDIIMGR